MRGTDNHSAVVSKIAFRHVLYRIGLLAGLFLPVQALAQQQEPPVVTAAKPVVRDIVEDDEFVGRFEAVDQVAIRSRVSGYLEADPFHGRRSGQAGRPALHHRPAPLPGRLRRGEVAGRRRDEPARFQQAAAATRRGARQERQPSDLHAGRPPARISCRRGGLPGSDRRAQDCQPGSRIHRDQGAAVGPHRPPPRLGRQSRAARRDAAHHDRGD